MQEFLKAAVIAATSLGASVAHAGGPVIIEEEGQPEVVAESPRSGWIVPVVIGLALVCAIACGGGDDDPAPGPESK